MASSIACCTSFAYDEVSNTGSTWDISIFIWSINFWSSEVKELREMSPDLKLDDFLLPKNERGPLLPVDVERVTEAEFGKRISSL